MKVLVVTDQYKAWEKTGFFDSMRIVSDDEYLSGIKQTDDSSYRIINLCSSSTFQSVGYYVSLLAEARGQHVIPSVLTTQDVQTDTIIPVINLELQNDIMDHLKDIKGETFELSLYFGSNIAKCYTKLARKLYGYLPIPFFKLFFVFKSRWQVDHIKVLTLSDIPSSHMDFLKKTVEEYLHRKHLQPYKQKKLTYSLAILHNPKEKCPPSDEKALQNFIHAASKNHIFAELIERMDYKLIREYDALFIRETTSVNHHTYHFSRRAQAEGLVVIDDPASILKCGNKVYLAEMMKKHNIPTPNTVLIHKRNWEVIGKKLSYPCVLKKPDSAFSLGVIKVDSPDEYRKKCLELLEKSEMIIAQEFLKSDYDWRIGIINNKVIFVCKYFMAKNHWQIYDWKNKKDPSGGFETPPINTVPPTILSTAKKAARLIGNGLYGVDLKYVNKKSYVIEINDNPNVDSGVEDVLPDIDVYDAIMKHFLEKIKERYQYD